MEIYIYSVANLSQRYDPLASQFSSLHVQFEVLKAGILVFPTTDLKALLKAKATLKNEKLHRQSWSPVFKVKI